MRDKGQNGEASMRRSLRVEGQHEEHEG